MPRALNEKFNRLMPESEGSVLCYEINRPISLEGYEKNFLDPAQSIIKQYGELRLLNYFTNYQGWEEEAAIVDLSAHVTLGRYVKKMAFVNAPEKEVMARLIRQSLTNAELRFFPENLLKDAIKWVKS